MPLRLPTLMAGLLLLAAPVFAQTATLTPFEAVEGEITGEPVSYRFSASTGEPLSFRAEALSGDLDPVLTIRNNAGVALISNDDYTYPDSRDALLEAVPIPEFGSYTVTVSAFGDTSGEFRLTMLPGYAELEREDPFDDAGDWTAADNVGEVEAVDEALILTLPENTSHVISFAPGDPLEDFLAQVRVDGITGRDWTLGLAVRGQSDGAYYAFVVSDRGQWRAVFHTEDEDRVLYDWTQHPAIRFDRGAFTVGVIATDTGFGFLFNGNLVGRIADPTLPASGSIGLLVGRSFPLGEISATFDDLKVTVPVEIDGAGLIPQNLILQDSTATVQALQFRRMLPGTGQIVLNIPQSFAEYGRAGVNILPLASGVAFENMALGATIVPSRVTGNGGCGLVLRMEDNTHYALAYLDGQGGFGVSERADDVFSPGLYGVLPGWNPAVEHHLVVIASGDQIYLYVDGQYAGITDSPSRPGGIGNAVVNFDPANTSCRFTNTWLWRWN